MLLALPPRWGLVMSECDYVDMHVSMFEIDNGPGGISWEGYNGDRVASYDSQEAMMQEAATLTKYGATVRIYTLAEFELVKAIDALIEGSE